MPKIKTKVTYILKIINILDTFNLCYIQFIQVYRA